MDSKAQISIEYLLVVLFAVILVIAATILALNLTAVAQSAKTQILQYRADTIESLMS